MVHRRAVVTIVALLTLIFLAASYDVSFGSYWTRKSISRVKDECVASCRLGGSVFSAAGDPDEIATAYQQDSKVGWWTDDRVEARGVGRFKAEGSVRVRSALWRSVLYWLRAWRLGVY